MINQTVQDGVNNNGNIKKYINLTNNASFAQKLIFRDLNNDSSSPTFSLYSKDDINTYLSNPYKYEKNLRKAVTYMYGASPHFKRLIQYFVGLTDLAYVVEPYKIDPKKANVRTTNINYRKTLDMLSVMNIKTQFPKILTVCLREDVFYGTFWITKDSIVIQQLPSEYCAISSIEDNVLNVSFNFQYFDLKKNSIDNYPEEFKRKYNLYKSGKAKRWIDLDSPNSFAIKCNNDILEYPIPPFAGLLREIYDIEDYKQLKLSRTALENYAMLVMNLPLSDGEWGIDENKALEFFSNLSAVLPDEVGSVLSPMGIDKINFEKSNTTDADTISQAEENLFTAAGVSSLLFNNEKASANALLLSIKADQAITFGIVKSIESVINRLLHFYNYGKNFKVTFLDVSPYNRKEVGELYLKACQYGIPMISRYCASQGLGQAELDNMSFLETEVLELQNIFKPLKSSAQMSSKDTDSKAATEEGGAPTKGVGDISESGEQNQEDA